MRRLEAKRQRSEHRAELWQRALMRWLSPGVLTVWVMFYVLVVAILLWGSDSMPWGQGERVDQDITARAAFSVEDQVRTERERRIARESAPTVYALNEQVLASIDADLKKIVDLAQANSDPARAVSEIGNLGWKVNPAAVAALHEYNSPAKYQKVSSALRQQLVDKYIVEQAGESFRKEESRSVTAILPSLRQPDRKVPIDLLIPVTNAPAVQQAAQQAAKAVFPPALQVLGEEIVSRELLGRPAAGKELPAAKESKAVPIWRVDGIQTRGQMEAAEKSIRPFRVTFKAGDLLAPAGTVLSDRELVVLNREHDAFLQAQRTDPVLHRKAMLHDLGMAGITFLVTLGLATYTIFYQEHVFDRPGRTMGLAVLIFIMVLLSRLNEHAQYPYDLPVEFSVAFVVVTAALLTVAYDQRLAIGASGGVAILATIASRGDFSLFLTILGSTGITIFCLKDVRSRSKIIAVGTLAGVGAFVASVSTGLMGNQEVKYVLVHAVAAGAAAVAAGFFVQGVLPNFERLFGVTTSMTLLEWADASRPLLRRLAQEAPGTYSHSVILSQLAEEACQAIGARGLLARVGALYHDIGKMQKAEYFAENQEARINRHDRLSPTMSLLIIVGHVKDGVELARAYGVPRVLRAFIGEHHGTTVVRYFHHAAAEAARYKGKHGREVSESEFRYPGPKPQSRETAILMICDGCESAVRALPEPTPGRIEGTVHQVVMDRLNDGQFDESNITLRELKMVEQAVVKTLAALHHGRIKYPKAVAPVSVRAGGQPAAASNGAGIAPEVETTSVVVTGTVPTPEVATQS
jgi:cyclic-di-AMP phosphodiesterase PgpH